MSRKGQVKLRQTHPDPIYGNRLVEKLISRVMKGGKKTVAQSLVYGALQNIREETKEDPIQVFISALESVKPTMEVRSRRVGGAAYQVPMPVRGSRRESLAIRWLIQAAQRRSNKEYHTFAQKLKAEILDAYKGAGGAVSKKKEMERVAEANRAFAHFRW